MIKVLWLIVLFGSVLCEDTDDVVGEKDLVDPPEEGDPNPREIILEGGVYVLNSLTFDGFIESQDTVLVEFYAPWCGHCKKLAPKYEAAAAELKKAEIPAVLAKVDVDQHSDLGSRFGIEGFPTLKIFKKGVEEPVDYKGDMDTNGIVEEMKKLSDPDWEPPESVVVILTQDNFDDIVNKEEIMLVEFFAPWCGHCKKLKPEYESAAEDLKDYPGIILATVDATEEKELAKKYGVTGYPTLKIFRNGKPSDYKGARTKDGIVTAMLTLKNPHSIEVTTKSGHKELEKSRDLKIVGLFPGLTKESLEFEVYDEATNEFREKYECKHTFDAAFASRVFKVTKPTILILYPSLYVAKGEQSFVTKEIGADFAVAELEAFVSSNNKPLAGDYDCTNCNKIYDDVDTVRVYTTKDYGEGYDKNTKYWQEKTAKVAKQFAGKGLHFVLCDESRHEAEMTEMKLNELGVETVFGIRTATGDKYSPDEEMLDDMDDFSETLEEFVELYLKGKLTVRRKTAPAPKKQSGPVTVVVGSTFDEIVMDTKKDVLVEFYAPWCGHCKTLEPKYIQLAKDLKAEENLIIAKIDATANGFPGSFDVKGFPTMYLVPAGGQPAVHYDGPREVEDLKKFIKRNAVVSLGAQAGKDEL